MTSSPQAATTSLGSVDHAIDSPRHTEGEAFKEPSQMMSTSPLRPRDRSSIPCAQNLGTFDVEGERGSAHRALEEHREESNTSGVNGLEHDDAEEGGIEDAHMEESALGRSDIGDEQSKKQQTPQRTRDDVDRQVLQGSTKSEAATEQVRARLTERIDKSRERTSDSPDETVDVRRSLPQPATPSQNAREKLVATSTTLPPGAKAFGNLLSRSQQFRPKNGNGRDSELSKAFFMKNRLVQSPETQWFTDRFEWTELTPEIQHRVYRLLIVSDEPISIQNAQPVNSKAQKRRPYLMRSILSPDELDIVGTTVCPRYLLINRRFAKEMTDVFLGCNVFYVAKLSELTLLFKGLEKSGLVSQRQAIRLVRLGPDAVDLPTAEQGQRSIAELMKKHPEIVGCVAIMRKNERAALSTRPMDAFRHKLAGFPAVKPPRMVLPPLQSNSSVKADV